MLARHRLRQVVNALGLATPLGLALAHAGGARRERSPARPDGLIMTSGYSWPLPAAPAFTIGDVVFVRRGRSELLARDRLLAHEARHAVQWAACGGLAFLPLYALASALSWWRTGNPFSRNVFERTAGLGDGGYPT